MPAYGATGWVLSGIFAGRVLGQALQIWFPVTFLPPADHFQESTLPYWLLLAAQVAILASMLYLSWRMQTGALVARRRLGTVLLAVGSLYMAVSVGRLAIGLAFEEAHPWFRAWIPAMFHVGLAAFVLTVSLYHVKRGK